MQKQERAIFKTNSTIFFISSFFFPRGIRQDVFDLYSFVRVADDYVDQVPADADGFYCLRRMWDETITNPHYQTSRDETDSTDVRVIKNMIRVARKHHFDLSWIDAFMVSMQSDLVYKEYQTIDETLHYIHGSAEVVGLMMANIMGLTPEAAEASKLQGRALQTINFIRDIHEDNHLGRQYFPAEELQQFNLPNLTRQTAHRQPQDFNSFMHFQLDRYDTWQAEAYTGYKYIPRRLRIALQTSTDMYNWTAQQIRKNPMLIYDKKIKPSTTRVIWTALTNYI